MEPTVDFVGNKLGLPI